MPVLINPYGPAILENYQEKFDSLILVKTAADFGVVDSTKVDSFFRIQER